MKKIMMSTLVLSLLAGCGVQSIPQGVNAVEAAWAEVKKRSRTRYYGGVHLRLAQTLGHLVGVHPRGGEGNNASLAPAYVVNGHPTDLGQAVAQLPGQGGNSCCGLMNP